MEKSIEFLKEMFPLDKQIIYETFVSKNEDIDETISSLINMCNFGTKHPPSYEEAMLNPATSLSTNINENNSKRRDSRRNLGKKEWKPPLIGKLSDDFLRIPNEISNNTASIGVVCKSCSKLQLKNDRNEACSSQVGSSHSLTISEIENMDTLIRRRMEDNVSQTRNATMRGVPNHDDIQYLDDERLALMLQNQEFLQIIQSDPEFQQALKDDHKAASSQRYEVDDEIWQEREDSIRFHPQDMDFDYGYEQSDIVDPDHLWQDQQLPSSDGDVNRICKAMGKASRSRINSLAKRFFSMRRRKSSRRYANVDSILENDGHPPSNRWETESTQNLITPDIDSDDWLNLSQNYPHSVSSSQRADSNTTFI